MKLFFSAGEPSGDLHGANLIASLRAQRPDTECVGFGGTGMARAGMRLLYPLTDLAIMWFGRAIANIDKFLHLGAVAESFFRTQRPDALILIDYPGFHWHLAKRAHRYGVPVYYFVPPQLWGWAGWRVKRIRKHFRCVLTALPFEETWYAERGVRTHYVGHPYFDEIAAQKLDDAFLAEQRAQAGEIVAILPGSRTQEVLSNLPMLVKAAQRIFAQRPGVRFLIAAYKESHAVLAGTMLHGSGLPFEIHLRRTPEMIELARIALAVSGSVSLELMVRRKPTIIVYKVGRLFHAIGRRVATVKYLTLVNLLADAAIFPEFPTSQDESEPIAKQALHWLSDPVAHANTVQQLDALNARVAVPGAVERAATFLLQDLAKS